MRSRAETVAEYLAELPQERRHVVETVREQILANLPPGYEEGMQYGMITYSVPRSRLPRTYNGEPLAYISLSSQKNHFALYLMGVYGDAETERVLRDGFAQAGKKLALGKSCLRFRRLEDLPLDVIGDVIRLHPVDDFVRRYEASRANRSDPGR